jgi:hypothetical protein
MRDSLEAGVRRFVSGWWFWALVLLALPNCGFDVSGLPPDPPNLNPGELPHSSAIMCDIEKYQDPARRCATAQDLAMGIPLAAAAEALVSGQASNVGLDYSQAAQAACGAGNPQAIDFQGSFPDGFAVCLNCGVIPVAHADARAVCVAQCQDLVANGDAPFPADTLAFCTANARPSTHFPSSGCFDNACSEGGTLRPDFADPRRIPSPVVWRDLIGAAAVGSNLTQTSPTTGGDTFAAGAVSEQWIHANDAYMEFEGVENNLSHVAGLAQVAAACPFPCPDSDPGFADIDFALSLNNDGRVYVLEAGALVAGPDLNNSFGTYVAGERFRVRVKDNFDGTATVSYTRIVGACVPGNPCNETVVFAHGVPSAAYPLRAAAAFREQNATLANVSIVRIQ